MNKVFVGRLSRRTTEDGYRSCRNLSLELVLSRSVSRDGEVWYLVGLITRRP